MDKAKPETSVLQFDPSWRFTSPGPAPQKLTYVLHGLIEKIAPQAQHRWSFVEQAKSYFGGQSRSSALSWAWSDLLRDMEHCAKNAPMLIDGFYTLCVDARQSGLGVPDVALINRLLAEHDAGYEIRPPDLVATRSYTPIVVPQNLSLVEQARTLIEESLAVSERLLDENQGRRAVQEILFLLETIITAFRETDFDGVTVQGKYFGPIIRELRAQGKGKAQEKILDWMQILHGYLSSPTGGGVRHGVDLKAGIAIQPHEARLYCNLIRSYLTYLMQEHERQIKAGI